MPHASSQTDNSIKPRSADQSMALERLGSAFATRLSVMRCIVRRMHDEQWQVSRPLFDLNADGHGRAVYSITTPNRTYSLVAFSHDLDPAARTDRVIAEAWDATFSLFDGEPTMEDLDRLAAQTPQQEAGRFTSSELVLSRVNKSVRLFDYVVTQLANGQQPDPKAIADAGYLMRTTAVYGNGKFGMADRLDYAGRDELAGPFRAELLTVYLIRCFCFDLVDHIASVRGQDKSVRLTQQIKRFVGIGNATGLGMAPFLVSHPQLIHNWFAARETALARVRSLSIVSKEERHRFNQVLLRAQNHISEWRVDDTQQMQRINTLSMDVTTLIEWVSPDSPTWSTPQPWNDLYCRAEEQLSVEAQEMLVSILLEPYPNLVDELAENLEVDEQIVFDPTMTVAELLRKVDDNYCWTNDFDFDNPIAHQHFWYSSEEKLEPRRGNRYEEAGAGCEMPLAIARDVQALRAALILQAADQSLKDFLILHPRHRATTERVQRFANYGYAEMRANLLSHDCRPIDILRGKLAFFGASRFDPKSDLWTRITLYQGAPLPNDIANDWPHVDDWNWACVPDDVMSTSTTLT